MAGVFTYDRESVQIPAILPGNTGAASSAKIVTGTFSFTGTYTTGGEDASALFNHFTGTAIVFLQDPIIAGTQTGKHVFVDHTNKKFMVMTNAIPYAEVAGASDQTALANLRFIAIGL